MATISPYGENWGPDSRQYWGEGPPTNLTDGDHWQKGDIIWSTATATTGQPILWRCSVSAVRGSTYGTWVAGPLYT